MSGDPYTISHPDAAELSAYHDGELRGFARGAVEEHLASCPRCRRELSRLDALSGTLRALPAVEPAPHVDDALYARLASMRPRRYRMPRPSRRLVAVIALLAAILTGYDIFVLPQSGMSLHSALQHSIQPMPAQRSPAIEFGAHSNAASGSAQAPSASGSAVQPNQAAKGNARSDGAASGAATQPNVQNGATSEHMPSTARPGAAGGPSLPTVDARLIARTAQVELRVPDVQKAYAAVSGIATRQGGYVSDSNNAVTSGLRGTQAATLTLRVPAQNYQAAMSALAVLPHSALTEQSSSQDITANYHDLQAQAQALQATRAQLLALMRQSHSIRDAMTVLDRLTAIDTNIDAVQSQIASSADSVMLSTITVTLTPEPRKNVVVPPRRHNRPSAWQPGRDLTSAVANVARALQTIASIAIYAAVYLFVPALLAALALLTHRLRRVVSG